MKKFKFRLQRVLETKEGIEKQRQRELGAKQGELLRQQKKLSELKEELKEQNKSQREKVSGSASAGELVMLHRWQLQLEKQIVEQLVKVSTAEKAVEKARLVLVEASKERKVLEKLREKRFEEHKKISLSQEQNILDDVGGRMNNGSALENGDD